MTRFRGDYPPLWKEIAASVRAEAGDRCIRCGHPNDGVGTNRIAVPGSRQLRAICDEGCRHAPDGKQRVLTVHHMDGDKRNCRWWNLLALCQVCHLQVQARVIPERPWLFEHSDWFRPYVAGFYAWYYGGAEVTREEAEADIARYLAMGQPWREGAA